jgi:hypothetical protein
LRNRKALEVHSIHHFFALARDPVFLENARTKNYIQMNILDLPPELVARVVSECPKTSVALSEANREARAITARTRAAQKCARRCARAWRAKTALKYVAPVRRAFAAVRRVCGGASEEELDAAGLERLDAEGLFHTMERVVDRDGVYVTTLSMLVALDAEDDDPIAFIEVDVTKASEADRARSAAKYKALDDDSVVAMREHVENLATNPDASCALWEELRAMNVNTPWTTAVSFSEESGMSYPTALTPNCFAESAVSFAKSALENIVV